MLCSLTNESNNTWMIMIMVMIMNNQNEKKHNKTKEKIKKRNMNVYKLDSLSQWTLKKKV